MVKLVFDLLFSNMSDRRNCHIITISAHFLAAIVTSAPFKQLQQWLVSLSQRISHIWNCNSIWLDLSLALLQALARLHKYAMMPLPCLLGQFVVTGGAVWVFAVLREVIQLLLDWDVALPVNCLVLKVSEELRLFEHTTLWWTGFAFTVPGVEGVLGFFKLLLEADAMFEVVATMVVVDSFV